MSNVFQSKQSPGQGDAWLPHRTRSEAARHFQPWALPSTNDSLNEWHSSVPFLGDFFFGVGGLSPMQRFGGELPASPSKHSNSTCPFVLAKELAKRSQADRDSKSCWPLLFKTYLFLINVYLTLPIVWNGLATNASCSVAILFPFHLNCTHTTRLFLSQLLKRLFLPFPNYVVCRDFGVKMNFFCVSCPWIKTGRRLNNSFLDPGKSQCSRQRGQYSAASQRQNGQRGSCQFCVHISVHLVSHVQILLPVLLLLINGLGRKILLLEPLHSVFIMRCSI